MRLIERIGPDLDGAAGVLRARRYGVIETAGGQLVGVRFRPWPKVSTVDTVWLSRRLRAARPGDCCRLFYNQPWRSPNYLALAYIVSRRDCTLATFQRALETLDEIARIKRSDAIVCDAFNRDISDRVLARYGWEPLAPSRFHRRYIKRFYGVYPARCVASVADYRPELLPATSAGRTDR